MDNLDKNINLIEQYLEGTLKGEKLDQFKEKLTNDEELKDAFQREEDIISGIKAAGKDQLRGRLNRIHDKVIVNKSQKTVIRKMPFYRRYRAMAAAAVIVLLAGFFLWQLNRPPLEERAFLTYYETPSFNDLVRGGTDTNDQLMASAKQHFDEGDFPAALSSLNELLKNNPSDDSALLLSGVCQLELNDAATAVTTLQKISPSFNRLDAATWYLGLAYLRAGKMEEAKKEFQKLTSGEVSTTPNRKSKAAKLLDDIS